MKDNCRLLPVKAFAQWCWIALLAIMWVPAATASDYADRAEITNVISAAEANGVDPLWAKKVLSSAVRQQSILDAIARPAEKTKPWYEYRAIFLTERRIREGVAFWHEYESVLDVVSQRTGVPAEVIVAVIGVETFYGRNTGSYRVVDALATLAFDYPKRSPFFTGELEAFLVLAWESGKDPLTLKGSYAGAMGYGQFMPSSYRAYAKAFEGESAPDIWTDPADAISSVGNYLKVHGWHPGQPVVLGAQVRQPEASLFDVGLKPVKSIDQLSALGIVATEPADASVLATPLRFEVAAGQAYWLGLQNFYAITRYNHSAMYAMAVWELSQEIAGVALEKDS
jgi:membrane-bound lytic murein transglycosylase B